MPDKELNIVIRATNSASPVFDKVVRDAMATGAEIRKAGGAGELDAVKRIGKTIQEVAEYDGGSAIKKSLDKDRENAQKIYLDEVKTAVEVERTGLAMDQARVGALKERANAAATLTAAMRDIDEREARELANRNSSVGTGDIRETADEDRAVAEREYQQVVERTAAVERESLEIEKQLTDAVKAKEQAGRRYAMDVTAIEKKEADSRYAIARENVVGFAVKLGGAAFIGRQMTEGINSVADSIRKAGEAVNGADGDRKKMIAGVVQAVPVLGGFVDAWHNVGAAITDAYHGRDSIEKITADAEASNAKIDKLTARRKLVIDVIQNFAETADPILGVKRQRDADIHEATLLRASGEINGTQESERIAVAKTRADEAIRQIRERIADEITTIGTASRDLLAQVDVAGAKSVGQMFDVKLAEIDRAVVDRRREIEKTITDTEGSLTLKADEKLAKVQALRDELKSSDAAGDAQRNRLNGDAVDARTADYAKIRIDALQREIAAGREGAVIDVQRLEIAEKYRVALDDINTRLADVNLKETERAVLERQRAALPAQQAAETSQADRDFARSRTGDINRITRESLQTQADLGDRTAQIEGEKLDIATKYAARLDEINKKLRDNLIVGDERRSLEDAKAALQGQASQEIGRAERGDVIVRQGDRKAAAVDSRFIGESVSQNSQVQVFGEVARANADSAKNTAENTKLMNEAQKETNRLLTSLTQMLANAPAV